jgi:HlyD family secretion protein
MIRQFRIILILWVAAVVALILINADFKSAGSVFLGIAQTDELVINFQSDTEIKQVMVTAGQQVREGDVLMEVDHPQLSVRLSQIENQLQEYRASSRRSNNENASLIVQLESQMKARASELNLEINQLTSQLELNKELNKELKSIPQNTGSSTQNPVELRIESLKEELTLSNQSYQAQINQLKGANNSGNNPVQAQIESLEAELDQLREEQKQQRVIAPIAGIIGSINFSPGEIVSSFTPIMTINSKTPSFVIGYIHENSAQMISSGDEVSVLRESTREDAIDGSVVGVGSRIVEYPIRLRKNPDIPLWGREVQIKIPEDNNLLLGEKLILRQN